MHIFNINEIEIKENNDEEFCKCFSLEIFLKLLNELNQSSELTCSNLPDFLLRKISNRNKIFPDLSNILYKRFFDIIFLLKLGAISS